MIMSENHTISFLQCQVWGFFQLLQDPKQLKAHEVTAEWHLLFFGPKQVVM